MDLEKKAIERAGTAGMTSFATGIRRGMKMRARST